MPDRALRLAIYASLLPACASRDEPNSESCGVTVESTVPTTGETAAYYRGNLEFRLSDATSGATITTSIPGEQAASADGLTVLWVLESPLRPSSAYEASLNYCAGEVDLEFETSEVGNIVSGADALVGMTYALDLGAGRVVEPTVSGSFLSNYLFTRDLLVAVVGSGPGTLDLRIGYSGDGGSADQDTCRPTAEFAAADFSENPYFRSGPGTLGIADDWTIMLEQAALSGSFAPAGDYFVGGVLEGTLDTRRLGPVMGLGDEPDAFCNLSASAGGTQCSECSDGAPYCVHVKVDQILGVATSGATLREVDGQNCSGCESPTETTDLSTSCEAASSS